SPEAPRISNWTPKDTHRTAGVCVTAHEDTTLIKSPIRWPTLSLRATFRKPPTVKSHLRSRSGDEAASRVVRLGPRSFPRSSAARAQKRPRKLDGRREGRRHAMANAHDLKAKNGSGTTKRGRVPAS